MRVLGRILMGLVGFTASCAVESEVNDIGELQANVSQKRICFEIEGTYLPRTGIDYLNGTKHPLIRQSIFAWDSAGNFQNLRTAGSRENTPVGCVDLRNVPTGVWDIRLNSYSQFPNGDGGNVNDLITKNNTDGALQHNISRNITSARTQTITLSLNTVSVEHQVLIAHTAAAWAIDRAGVMRSPTGPKGVMLRVNRTSSVGSGGDANLQKVDIKTGSHRNAGIIAHEVGHAVLKLMAPSSYEVASDGPVDVTSGPCALPNAHNVESMEVQWVAYNEGFADYFAAFALNDENGNDCRVGSFNCKDDAGSLNADDVPWMENNCGINLAGRGSESDWARTFWNMSANGAGSPNAMIKFIRGASEAVPFTLSSVFDSLDAFAERIPFSPIYLTWVAESATHGLDH